MSESFAPEHVALMAQGTTIKRLTEARRDGADRIYGWPVRARTVPRTYSLKAIDRTGRCYFQRELAEPVYLAAVAHWIQLGNARQALSAGDES